MSKTLVVLREAAAGAATACVALPLAVASGILVYSQFGAEFLALGAIAGLVTVIGGGALASLFYGSLLVKSLPAKSALIQSSIAGAMVASIGDIRVVMVALPFCIMLASAWQIGLALSGLSKIVNMTPYPVVAGFASGVGLLIIFGQLPTLLGVPSILDVAQAGNLSVSRLLFGAGVISAMFAVNRATPHIPAPVIGLIVGYAIVGLSTPVARRPSPPIPLSGGRFAAMRRSPSWSCPHCAWTATCGSRRRRGAGMRSVCGTDEPPRRPQQSHCQAATLEAQALLRP
jgi:MFS superfamily sulfate permease-like transporter